MVFFVGEEGGREDGTWQSVLQVIPKIGTKSKSPGRWACRFEHFR